MLVAAIRTCCPRAGETAVGGTQAWHSGVGDWGTLRHPIPARGLCPLSRLRCHTLLGSCVCACRSRVVSAQGRARFRKQNILHPVKFQISDQQQKILSVSVQLSTYLASGATSRRSGHRGSA